MSEPITPAMDLVRLGWIAAQLGDIGWSDESASAAQAAALIPALASPTAPPLVKPGDFEIGEWIKSLPSWPDGWPATPLSELVCLVSAAFDRWPLAIPANVEPPAPAPPATNDEGEAETSPRSPHPTQ